MSFNFTLTDVCTFLYTHVMSLNSKKNNNELTLNLLNFLNGLVCLPF